MTSDTSGDTEEVVYVKKTNEKKEKKKQMTRTHCLRNMRKRILPSTQFAYYFYVFRANVSEFLANAVKMLKMQIRRERKSQVEHAGTKFCQ